MHNDEALDRIFEAISQTQPPPGMNHRLLQTLHTQASVSTGRPWFAAKVALSTAIAALLLIAVLILSPRLHQDSAHGSSQVALQPGPHSIPNTGSVPQSTTSTHRATHHGRQQPSQPVRQLLTAAAPPPESYPAPPMPLTEQESLLLRLVRRAGPDQLAMLDPDLRLQREITDQADFKNFFEPPTPAADDPLPLLPTGDTL